MEIQKNMAAVMRVMKDKSGKSMTELSAELEISRSALQEYLSGTGNPSAATIDHLAKKLNVDASVLVSGLFSDIQLEVLLKMLDMFNLLSGLSTEKKRHFVRLLRDMISLWEEGDCDA